MKARKNRRKNISRAKSIKRRSLKTKSVRRDSFIKAEILVAQFRKEKEKVFHEDQIQVDDQGNEIKEKKGACHKISNLFKWYTLLRGVDDEKLRIICGTDAALYLIFIRYASKFFAVITLFNTVIIMPFYLTDANTLNCSNITTINDKPAYCICENEVTNCQLILVKLLTFVSIYNDIPKTITVFVLMQFFYTLFAFYLMYKYWTKSHHWRNKEHSHDTKFQDQDIQAHTVLVTGLDKSLPVDKMSQQLTYIFSQLLPGDKVIQCRAVGRFDSTLEKAKQLREYKRKYRYYKRINAIGEEEAKKLQIPY